MGLYQLFSRAHTNLLHTGLLLGALFLLLVAIGWSFAGWIGIGAAVLLGILPLYISIRIMPSMVLKMYQARPLAESEASELFAIVGALSADAGLISTPKILFIGGENPIIFSVGKSADGAIAFSKGLLRLLNLRELTGVLGHEISHLRNNDTWVMSVADVVSRITSTLSLTGQILLILNLPLLLLGKYQLPWGPVLLMIFAPSISALLQLALSRTREYDADIQGARLTADPDGLASALKKLESFQTRFMSRILAPGRQGTEPSLLRTHPQTAERIRRLNLLAEKMHQEEQDQFSITDNRK